MLVNTKGVSTERSKNMSFRGRLFTVRLQFNITAEKIATCQWLRYGEVSYSRGRFICYHFQVLPLLFERFFTRV